MSIRLGMNLVGSYYQVSMRMEGITLILQHILMTIILKMATRMSTERTFQSSEQISFRRELQGDETLICHL